MSRNTYDDKLTLLYVMGRGCQAANYNLSHYWPRSTLSYAIVGYNELMAVSYVMDHTTRLLRLIKMFENNNSW